LKRLRKSLWYLFGAVYLATHAGDCPGGLCTSLSSLSQIRSVQRQPRQRYYASAPQHLIHEARGQEAERAAQGRRAVRIRTNSLDHLCQRGFGLV